MWCNTWGVQERLDLMRWWDNSRDLNIYTIRNNNQYKFRPSDWPRRQLSVSQLIARNRLHWFLYFHSHCLHESLISTGSGSWLWREDCKLVTLYICSSFLLIIHSGSALPCNVPATSCSFFEEQLLHSLVRIKSDSRGHSTCPLCWFTILMSSEDLISLVHHYF